MCSRNYVNLDFIFYICNLRDTSEHIIAAYYNFNVFKRGFTTWNFFHPWFLHVFCACGCHKFVQFWLDVWIIRLPGYQGFHLTWELWFLTPEILISRAFSWRVIFYLKLGILQVKISKINSGKISLEIPKPLEPLGGIRFNLLDNIF